MVFLRLGEGPHNERKERSAVRLTHQDFSRPSARELAYYRDLHTFFPTVIYSLSTDKLSISIFF